MKGTSSWDNNLQSLLHDAAMLQTFVRASAFSTVTPNGCPVQILSTVEIFASQRRHDFAFAENATNIVVLEDALQKMRSYDIMSWAVHNTTEDSKVSSEDLARLGTIWQLSADIYACRVLACLTGSTLASESLQVQGLIAAYAFIEREDDELIKCLIWPTFIAGAASTTYEARTWVLKTLDRIWNRGHCANTKNAAKVLGKLWEKYDQTNLSSSHIYNGSNATGYLSMGYSVWDWRTAGRKSQVFNHLQEIPLQYIVGVFSTLSAMGKEISKQEGLPVPEEIPPRSQHEFDVDN
ncbi:hypothetical protein LZL87_013558 [Fusarium oxysporum]|nr:hypothetical protein LZL87_013558 [Fusarium oxysporum]